MELNKIPTQLQLGGQTIKIVIDNDIIIDDNLGLSHDCKNLITIANKYKSDPLSFESIEQTIWHEIFHLILNKLGYDEQSDNEIFVQSVSLLIHQAIKTLK